MAVGLAVFALLGSFGQPRQSELLLVLLTLGLSLPLIWRRRAPVAVFAVIAAVAFVQWLVAVRLSADIALLVAMYSVASTRSRLVTIAAAGVLEVGAVLAALRWGGSHWSLLVFVLLSGMVAAAAVTGANMGARRRYLVALEDRSARLEVERDQQAQLAAAAERARLAREMHDIIAHNLSVMIALADGARLTRNDPDRAARAMEQVTVTGRQALGEMRRLLGVLREAGPESESARQPQPGVDQIGDLVEQMRTTGLRAELRTEGALADLSPGLQLTVYRLVQEALTNTLKHARKARSVDVSIRCGPSRVEVEVADDGLPPREGSAGLPSAGHGIIGMRERAAVYGGTLRAGSTGTGWQVRALFELAADAQ